MTPPDPARVAEVAAKLSHPMRRAMRRQCRGCYHHELGPATTGTIKALHRRGLIDGCDNLSALGLAVRAILQEPKP